MASPVTYSLVTGQRSRPVYVSAGARVTASSTLSVEYTDAANNPDAAATQWALWPNGSYGYGDAVRAMWVRATGSTGSGTLTLVEGFNDPGEPGRYWQEVSSPDETYLPYAAQQVGMTDRCAIALRNSIIALSLQRVGTSNMKLMCLGDSTTAGLPGDGTYTGRTTSYPTVLNTILTAIGATSRLNSAFGEPTNTFNNTNFTTYDSRWTMGTNWLVTSLGTNFVRQFAFNNATPANLTFTPASSCDTYEVYYVSNPAYGTVTIASTGASPSTINMAAAVAIRKATISVTAGQPLIITPPVSTAVNVCGVVGYTAATKEISVLNMGQGGIRSAGFADRTQVYSNSYLLDTIDPDMAIICLGINDWLNAVDPATYQSNLQAIVTQFAANGCNSVLVSPFPSGITNVTLATQQRYQQAMKNVAVANDLLFVDMFSQVGSYEVAQPLGYYQASQTVHPSVAGYNAMAYAIAKQIKGLFI